MVRALVSAKGQGIYVDDIDVTRTERYVWREKPSPGGVHGRKKRDYLCSRVWNPHTRRTEEISLQRFIMNAEPHTQVKFRDGNPYNCRRSNLMVSNCKYSGLLNKKSTKKALAKFADEGRQLEGLALVHGHKRLDSWVEPYYTPLPSLTTAETDMAVREALLLASREEAQAAVARAHAVATKPMVMPAPAPVTMMTTQERAPKPARKPATKAAAKPAPETKPKIAFTHAEAQREIARVQEAIKMEGASPELKKALKKARMSQGSRESWKRRKERDRKRRERAAAEAEGITIMSGPPKIGKTLTVVAAPEMPEWLSNVELPYRATRVRPTKGLFARIAEALRG